MTQLNFLYTIFSSIVNAVIPPRKDELAIESLTLDELQYLRTDLPAGEGLPYHHPTVRGLIWELKYNRNTHALALAGELLAEELLAIAGEEIGKPILIPVPMHSARKLERGYNQTELLCKAALFALRSLGEVGQDVFEYDPTALKRIHNTPPQQTLSRRARLYNVKGSMAASATKVRGRVCIVLDDVSTTGATLEEAKRALKAAGARRVHTVALARS